MAEEATSAKGGMRLWLRVVLGLSLALNLLVIGAVAGAYFKGGKHGGPHVRAEQMGGVLTGALSPRDRREIGREMRRLLRDDPSGKARQTELFQGLLSDLRADRFDREAVAGRMAQHRSLISERMAMGQGLLLERLEQMSPEERAALADRLEEGMRRRLSR